MSYTARIKFLESSYNQAIAQIEALKLQESVDQDKINNLNKLSQQYLNELRELRRREYERSQEVDMDDDR